MSERTYYSAQQMLTSYRVGQDVGDAFGQDDDVSLISFAALGPGAGSAEPLPPKTGLDSAAAAAAKAGMIGSIVGAIGDIFTTIPAIMGMAQAPKQREHELKMARVGLKTTRSETKGLGRQADIASAESAAMTTSVGYIAGALVIAAAIGGGIYLQGQKRR